jgi:hypothetical protein
MKDTESLEDQLNSAFCEGSQDESHNFISDLQPISVLPIAATAASSPSVMVSREGMRKQHLSKAA